MLAHELSLTPAEARLFALLRDCTAALACGY